MELLALRYYPVSVAVNYRAMYNIMLEVCFALDTLTAFLFLLLFLLQSLMLRSCSVQTSVALGFNILGRVNSSDSVPSVYLSGASRGP